MLLNIWVTRDCNFRCKYCYVPSYETSMNNTCLEQLFVFLDELYEQKYFTDNLVINFHGGEPLLNIEIIFKIINFTKDRYKKLLKNLNYGMTTNGYLLTKEISDYISENFKYNLSVSIDGGRETFDLLRKTTYGNSGFDKVIDNVTYLLSKNDEVRARMTYTSKTVNKIFENINYVSSLGFKNIVLAPNLFDDSWEDEHLSIFNTQIDKVYQKYAGDNAVSINLIEDRLNRTKGMCTGGHTSLNIDYNGQIYPCTMAVGTEMFNIGNIFEGIDLLKLNNIMQYRYINNSECDNCDIMNCCNGKRCFIINKLISDNYNSPSPWMCGQNNIIYNKQIEYNLIK